MSKRVVFETIIGPAGTGHYIDNYRCGGRTPYGGSESIHRALLDPKDIVSALAQSPQGRAALDAYVQRASQSKEPTQ